MSLKTYQEEVTERSAKQQEPQWILEKRLQAVKKIFQLSPPQVQKTDVSRWKFTEYRLSPPGQAITSWEALPEKVLRYLEAPEQGNLYIQKNQEPWLQTLSAELQQQGVILTSLSEAAEKHPELVRKHLFQAFSSDEHQLAALHGAYWSGAFLYIPRHVEVKVPIQMLFALAGDGVGAFPHVLLVAETGSRVELVANFIELDGQPAVFNSVIEAVVGAGAQVRVATVNVTGESVVESIYRRGVVDRDGNLEWVIGDFSEGHLLSDQSTQLNGEGANVDVKSVALAAGSLRSNITSSISHHARHTTSDIHARAVVKDAATNILNSITKIEKGASKSDGQQSGKVLMLDPQARGDANPILLIDENDVSAGHAASVGRVDPLQVYYMMSRGLSRQEAEKLIVFGFLDTIISEIASERLQKQLHNIVEGKFRYE